MRTRPAMGIDTPRLAPAPNQTPPAANAGPASTSAKGIGTKNGTEYRRPIVASWSGVRDEAGSTPRSSYRAWSAMPLGKDHPARTPNDAEPCETSLPAASVVAQPPSTPSKGPPIGPPPTWPPAKAPPMGRARIEEPRSADEPTVSAVAVFPAAPTLIATIDRNAATLRFGTNQFIRDLPGSGVPSTRPPHSSRMPEHPASKFPLSSRRDAAGAKEILPLGIDRFQVSRAATRRQSPPPTSSQTGLTGRIT